MAAGVPRNCCLREELGTRRRLGRRQGIDTRQRFGCGALSCRPVGWGLSSVSRAVAISSRPGLFEATLIRALSCATRIFAAAFATHSRCRCCRRTRGRRVGLLLGGRCPRARLVGVLSSHEEPSTQAGAGVEGVEPGHGVGTGHVGGLESGHQRTEGVAALGRRGDE